MAGSGQRVVQRETPAGCYGGALAGHLLIQYALNKSSHSKSWRNEPTPTPRHCATPQEHVKESTSVARPHRETARARWTSDRKAQWQVDAWPSPASSFTRINHSRSMTCSNLELQPVHPPNDHPITPLPPSCATSHWRTVRALSIVSAVVNVLETTTTWWSQRSTAQQQRQGLAREASSRRKAPLSGCPQSLASQPAS
jgi:hypothetical protein